VYVGELKIAWPEEAITALFEPTHDQQAVLLGLSITAMHQRQQASYWSAWCNVHHKQAMLL
jgi:hypothetical protein